MRILFLWAFLAAGLYFLIADRLKIPYLKTSKAIMNMERSDKKLTTAIEAVIMDLSIRLSRFIPMDRYKKNRLSQTLDAAGIKMTPECYQAHAIIKALAVGLLVIPALSALQRADQEKGTNYTETLRMYAAENFNVTRTAQRLFIHRTSLQDRLNRIRELTGIDLECPEARFDLLFSLRLLK